MAVIENKTREFSFTVRDFNALRALANQHTGIVVSDDKYDMYYARLVKRLRKLGLRDFSEYVLFLEQNLETEFTPFIDSITTNLTSFFREKHHFNWLENALIPAFVAQFPGSNDFRIWSAGCSTGEEPYSIAITVQTGMGSQRSIVPSILASDIDTTVLSKASSGVYDISRIEGMDSAVKKRWFLRGKGSKAGLVRVSPELQSIIQFRQINLMQEWNIKDKFHIIFCRNVVIYFDRPTKLKLLNRFADQLLDNGFLILGHSESLHGLSDRFETIGKTIYRKIR